MGNQGTCLDGFRDAAEIVRSGAIGAVREVHVWTNRPIWPQGIARPRHIDPIPATLRWDLWLGPAPHRPFAAARKDDGFLGYAPFHWRGFWDFGTGALGDMACHLANLPFFALELGAPDWVEADGEGGNAETAPRASTIRFGFPARGDRGPVVLTWYDGGRKPPPDVLHDQGQAGGFLLVGDRGRLYSPTDYGETFELLPREQFRGFELPERTLPRSPGVHDEWLDCIASGDQPLASFEYAAPFTEAMLLGNVALRLGRRVEWDAEAMAVKDCPEADRYLRKEYRRGFEPARA
jgi:predicted dehydrogenase